VREYALKTLPLILGLGMTFSNEVFFRFFGSFLPEGGTSSVNYALRTMMIVVAMFGQASGVAFFPFIARLAAERKFDEITALLNRVLRNIALYLFPLSALLMVVSRPVVEILYRRGKFDEHSAAETASVFTVYLLGSFFFSAAIVIARTFYALQRMLLPMAVSTAISLATIPLYLVFSAHLGARGIAAAGVAGMLLQSGVLYACWISGHGSWKQAGGEAAVFAKIIGICAAGALLGIALLRFAAPLLHIGDGMLKNIALVAIVSLPMLMFIFFLYERLGLQRFVESIRGIARRK
jgi:putative peptidoglycan lipid II flippase